MKYAILSLFAGICLLFGPTAYADSVDDYYKIDQRLDKMKTDLNLNEQQVKEIKPVMDNYKDKVHDARKEKDEKIDKILTSEQKDKMDEFRKSKDEAMDKGWWQF